MLFSNLKLELDRGVEFTMGEEMLIAPGTVAVVAEGRRDDERMVKGPIENDGPFLRTYAVYDW
jgi:hypothetical protein